MSRICRVNVGTGEITYEPVPETWARLGGRALGARILLDEVPATCDPLGPHNKLIFAPGTLVGHMVSSCDRISVCGKSPLTGGVKEANAGGTTALKLVWLGIHALIIEGQPAHEQSHYLLHIGKDETRLEPADELAGLGVHATAERLLERFGPKVGIAMIGPAGEKRMAAAGIVHLDKDRVPGRISARGGLGALMGSKGLKAIVIDDGGTGMPPLVDKALFNDARKRYIKSLLNAQANDLGLDTIEVGAALGVTAEAGLMEWGDGQRAMKLLDEIQRGTILGRALGGWRRIGRQGTRRGARASGQEPGHGGL